MTSKSGGIQPKTKKELLKLSKPKLIKIGKKQKVTITGSKLQIIDRILKSTSKKNGKKSTMKNKTIIEHKASNILSQRQRELLIHGYVNKINKYNYPNILIVILSEYIAVTCLKFDICPNKYLNSILKNGSIIKRKTYQVAYTDYWMGRPWQTIDPDLIVYASSYTFNYGTTNKWSIHIQTNRARDSIGIISDINACRKNCRLRDIDCNSYYIYPENNAYVIAEKLLKNDKVVEKQIRKRVHHGWSKDDVITVILDSKNWKLKFIVNGKNIGASLDVEKDTYYAAIGSVTNPAKYALL